MLKCLDVYVRKKLITILISYKKLRFNLFIFKIKTLLLDCEKICDGLSKHAHFHNFGTAFLTLFQIFTGDNWNKIMEVN